MQCFEMCLEGYGKPSFLREKPSQVKGLAKTPEAAKQEYFQFGLFGRDRGPITPVGG